jgi:hypothetical protein
LKGRYVILLKIYLMYDLNQLIALECFVCYGCTGK